MVWLLNTSITTIIIGLIWIRIIRQISHHTPKKQIMTIVISSIISVSLLSGLYYMSTISTTFLHYQSSIIITLIIISSICYYTKSRRWWRIIQAILWIGLSSLGQHYSLPASSEETLKWTYLKKTTSWMIGEFILLGIMSAIVFGRTENIIYMIQSWIHQWSSSQLLMIAAQRGIIPIIVHIGSLALSIISYHLLQKRIPIIMARAIGLTIGTASHYLFNMLQIRQRWLWSAIVILCYLVVISYSLFRSDLLYLPKETTKEESSQQI